MLSVSRWRHIAAVIVSALWILPIAAGFVVNSYHSRNSWSVAACALRGRETAPPCRSHGAPKASWNLPRSLIRRVNSGLGSSTRSGGSTVEDEEDEEAAILAWKKVEKVLTEKARAESKARAEAKARAAQEKARAPKPLIIWDVMNTICYDPFYVEVPAFFGMSLEELYAAKDPATWEAFELGHISEEEAMSTFFKDRRAFDHTAFVGAITSHYAFLPGMEALLDELYVQGYNMHAMSNYPPWYARLEQKLNLKRFLKWTFVSCEARLRKPDPAAYRELQRRLGPAAADPSRCLLVDDSERNVAAARDAGWRAVRFADAAALRRELPALGVKLD